MIERIIDNTVGKNANIVCVLTKDSVKKYQDLDYKGLEFTNDLAGYFEPNEHGPQRKINMVVIDANNEYKVVKKSLQFALKKVGKTGCVVLANSLPPNRLRYVTPQKRPGNWFGEVWRVVSGLNYQKNVDFVTCAIGNGYTVILGISNTNLYTEEVEPTLKMYSEDRVKYARLVRNPEGLRNWYEEGRREKEGNTQAS